VLLKGIVGAELAVSAVDYDTCLHIRTVLSRLPAHRTKQYRRLSLDKVILRAERDGKALLSPITQQGYLATLNQILDLALKKRLIVANPADGLKPLKKDGVAAEAKRLPFTARQLGEFFDSGFYRECAQHPVPYRHDKAGWRFWLPLLCLFMGMRPNEACQMHADDVKQTEAGTWYVDIVVSADEDETASTAKTLKTAYSRRRIPVHPELIAIGFLNFASECKGGDVRLFPSLKPDEYGSCSKYALKRFRDTFLPAAITMELRQSFYSFRHNFRDALRAIDAPPDALQALGGWSQGRLVSDNYGEKSNPDYQVRFVRQIAYPGVDLKYLYVSQN
jgi:integrase